ncbi:MAG: regulatory protein RecX [Lachnospiraceae bacterium]|nr:regulatory protein RecX [Lachnospiraceae bacterium]
MEESRKAKLRALKILTRMDKTEQELEDALNRAGFSPEAVREAMDYVRSFGYLNDANYARKYVECYKDRKSRQKIRFDLMRKGIGKELVDEAIENCEDMDELDVLRRALHKKWNCEEKPDEKNLNRIAASLSRQGFSSHDIWQVLREENLT